MTVVSILLGAAVEVGVGSNPPSPSKSTSLFLHYIIFRCTRIRNDPWPEYLLELVYL